MVKMYSLLIAGADDTESAYKRWLASVAMKKQFALLVAALVVVLVLAGQLARAAAGPEPNDIQDALPAWSSDARWLVYDRTAPSVQHVLKMSASGKQTTLVSGDGRVRGFVDHDVYLLVETNGATQITTGQRFTPPVRVLEGTDASASSEGRIAYIRDGSLYATGFDGSGEQLLATGIQPPSWDVLGPVWSPDGTQLVVASGSSLVLVQADGSGSRVLFSGANQSVNPSWSPDGQTIAFERNFGRTGRSGSSGSTERTARCSPATRTTASHSSRRTRRRSRSSATAST